MERLENRPHHSYLPSNTMFGCTTSSLINLNFLTGTEFETFIVSSFYSFQRAKEAFCAFLISLGRRKLEVVARLSVTVE
jgi:hypothetical protein